MDIENLIKVESFIDIESPVDIGCYSASFYILVLGYIFKLSLFPS